MGTDRSRRRNLVFEGPVQLYPIPDGSYTIYIKYTALQPRLANNADQFIIPNRYSNTLVNMVVGDILLKQGDEKAKYFIQLAEQGISTMSKEQDIMWDYAPSIRPNDGGQMTTDASYPFSYV